MSTRSDSPTLAGRRVLITRPESRAREWIEGFRARGCEVVHFPVFALALPGVEEIQRTLAALAECAERPAPWVAFTSVASVQHLFEILQSGGDEEQLAERFRIAVVGPATKRAAEEAGLTVSLVAGKASGAELARDLLRAAASAQTLATQTPALSVLHPVSSKSLPDFAEAIRAGGGEVWSAIVSVHEKTAAADPRILDDAVKAGLDLLTFASPSAVEGLMENATPATAARLRAIPALAVGGTTERALREENFARTQSAASPSLADVLQCAVELLT